MADEVMAYLAQPLANNETLETLNLGDDYSRITNTGWALFCHLLCDKSSIDSTCASNHTLQLLGDQGVPINLVILYCK